MRVDQVYRRRFSDTETRKALWETLVTHFFQKYIDSDDVVLDLPSGYAEFINGVQCKKKYAVDINPDSAKMVAKDVTFHLASSTDLPLKKHSVDKVFISNFFEHLTREDISKTIDELKRIVKPGGQVLVLQPNIRFAYHNYWMFFDHITPIDDRALDEIFQIKGFGLKSKILKFLPFTSAGRLPAKKAFVYVYLKCRFLWPLMGRQSFMVYQIDEE